MYAYIYSIFCNYFVEASYLKFRDGIVPLYTIAVV
jgi:hypothetical protein